MQIIDTDFKRYGDQYFMMQFGYGIILQICIQYWFRNVASDMSHDIACKISAFLIGDLQKNIKRNRKLIYVIIAGIEEDDLKFSRSPGLVLIQIKSLDQGRISCNVILFSGAYISYVNLLKYLVDRLNAPTD